MRLFWKVILIVVALGVVAAAIGYWMTAPKSLPETAMNGITPDATHGKEVFDAGGCASCHAAPESKDRLILAGGKAITSDFGTFHAPNISSDPKHGIGSWTLLQFANALKYGTSPAGQHLYPAFPYATYTHATLQDIADLHAYMKTLPADPTPSQPNDLRFPFSIRAGVGLWKALFLSDDWVLQDPATDQLRRGRYLVEALGHCGECHTPRNALGGLEKSKWLGGAPNPAGQGSIPNITSGGLTWSEDEIAEYLSSGFTPDFDVAGGEMADVVDNISKLSDEDRAAIAAYLKAVPPVVED